jgi:hypothetical protein
LPHDFAYTYETPFTTNEIQHAIQSGGKNKVSGRDGLGIEFYEATLPLIGNEHSHILSTIFMSHNPTRETRNDSLPIKTSTDAHTS